MREGGECVLATFTVVLKIWHLQLFDTLYRIMENKFLIFDKGCYVYIL